MYRNKATGLIDYETFEEILNANIVLASEYDGDYYIRIKPQERFDNCVYKINKETEKISFIYYTEYILDIMDKATPINPKTLKRAS